MEKKSEAKVLFKTKKSIPAAEAFQREGCCSSQSEECCSSPRPKSPVVSVVEGEDVFDERTVRILRLNTHQFNVQLIDVAVSVLNDMLGAGLTNSNIRNCSICPSWVGLDDTDILVEFENSVTRKRVYSLRSEQNEGLFYVCDDLKGERLLIWKHLYRDFGEHRIYTDKGDVILVHFKDNDEVIFQNFKDVQIFYEVFQLEFKPLENGV